MSRLTDMVQRRVRALPIPAVAGAVLLGCFVVLGVVGPLLAPDDPSATTATVLAAPSWHHLLGTTQTGQDVLSQVLAGGRVTLLVGAVAGVLTTAVAAIMGLAAGYLPGLSGEALSSLANLFLVLPVLPLVIVMSAYLQSASWLGVVVVIVVVGWATGARVVRAQTLSLRRRDFVTAARASGERSTHILWAEVLPHVMPVLASGFVTSMLFAVVTQASLAFIGLGGVGQWSWGTMLYWAQNADAFSVGAWWWIVPPGACLALLGTALVLVNFGVDAVVGPSRSGAGHRPGAPASASGGVPAPAGGAVALLPPGLAPDLAPDSALNPAGTMAAGVDRVLASDTAPPQVASWHRPRGPGADTGSVWAPLLQVQRLTVVHGTVPAVRGVDLQVGRGEVVGIAGETGSGKSTLVHAITRLLRPPAAVVAGQVWLHPRAGIGDRPEGSSAAATAMSTAAGIAPADEPPVDLVTLDAASLRRLRWERLAVVLQGALHALNPVLTVQAQLVDALRAHRPGLGRAPAARRAADVLELVGLDRRHLRSYAHELSGGMRQRVLIAMALLLSPDLVVLDEPTTALDTVTQRAVVDEVLRLHHEIGFAVVLVTHDLSLLLETADTVAVLHAGQIVEVGPAADVHRCPAHPYTAALLAARVTAATRPTSPPVAHAAVGTGVHGMAATPPIAASARRHAVPVGAAPRPVLAADGLSKAYRQRTAPRVAGHLGGGGHAVRAVDGVSLELHAGQATALVGASGSGKSTVARLLARLELPDDGRVLVDGRPAGRTRAATAAYRRAVQLVLQDPYASLNPVHTAGYHVRRAVVLHRGSWSAGSTDVATGASADEIARVLLTQVGLQADVVFDRLPGALSGGQRQRVAIARALAARPAVLIADEPVSMLDVSVRAGILAVLDALRAEHGMALLHITHDIASAWSTADTVVVMDAGRVVEAGPTDQVLGHPSHRATQRLVDAQPDPARRRTGAAGAGAGADRVGAGAAGTVPVVTAAARVGWGTETTTMESYR